MSNFLVPLPVFKKRTLDDPTSPTLLSGKSHLRVVTSTSLMFSHLPTFAGPDGQDTLGRNTQNGKEHSVSEETLTLKLMRTRNL